MTEQGDFQMPSPDPALKRLDFLVGKWEMSAVTEETPMGPPGKSNGVETFEWMDGGFFLIHHWEGTMEMGGMQMSDTGYEFIDYDPESGKYRTHFFNNLGPFHPEQSKYSGDFEGDTLVLVGPARFSRTLNEDGSITFDAEVPIPDGTYAPFMHGTLTKVQ